MTKRRGILVALAVCAAMIAPVLGVAAKGDRGNFPVREPDETTPFFVLYSVLKAGVNENESEGLAEYLGLCMEDRKSSPEKLDELKQKEWAALRQSAGAYLAYDLHGFKVFVIKMSPGDVDAKTRKVYFTIKNQIEPDERSGLCIVEKDGRGQWKLRSVTL